ncbi:hypothetical protein DW760_11550 [Coprobacillus sp. AM29-13]|nr:hypothetical protein DWX48_11455 [Coprobacillus sp. AF19-3]RHT50812.1 hypothetical protein DW760_11550 [Coprobacillus sp. AM29-13]
MVKSIFELEKRTDIRKECLRMEEYLDRPQFIKIDGYSGKSTFWSMANSCFKFWPYRYTATSVYDFFDLIQLPMKVKEMNNTEYFYYLQFIFDFVMWISSYNDDVIFDIDPNEDLYDLFFDNEDEFDLITTNIKIIMEFSNYSIEKINDHYTFIKRDADTDSILSIIENENDLRLALLEYNDFRIENDINEKRIILKKLGDYLEPKRKEFNSINKSLTDDIFYMLNKFYIRHNNDGNIKFDSNTDYIKWYDKLFKMIIHLIRSKYILDVQKELKDYKK